MCTPSLSPGITLGKVTLQLKQSMKWQTVKLSIGHTPNIWHKNFLLVSGSRWHISVFNTEWSVHHLENNLNKLHCLSKSKVFKESRTVKLNKPRKYERAINNTCEMESFLLLHNLPDLGGGWILVTGSPLFNEHCNGLGFVMEWFSCLCFYTITFLKYFYKNYLTL